MQKQMQTHNTTTTTTATTATRATATRAKATARRRRKLVTAAATTSRVTAAAGRLQQRQQLLLLLPGVLLLLLLLLLQTESSEATRYNRNGQSSSAYQHKILPTHISGNNNHNNNNNNNDVYAIADSQPMTEDFMAHYAHTNAIGGSTSSNAGGGGSGSSSSSSSSLSGADNTLIVHQQQLSSCQTVCACKWKGGKQTVECIDRLLILIPEHIDPNTQVLDMSGNKLQTLSNEQFIRANLLNLQKLYLRNCKIGLIEAETFKGLTNLVELDLSHNLLVVVPSLALSYISSLRELTLASNHIHKIEANAFASTPALHKLDLSHCDIQTISPQAFAGLQGLTLLRLNGNKLSEVLPKTIETLSRLHGIELHDNPWLCDCRLRDAKLWLMQRNIPYPVAPVCAGGPERVIDRTFAELHVDDFACRPEMLPISHYVEATMGENASIVCRARAVPAAVINWYWNGRLLSNNSAFSSFQRVHMYEEAQGNGGGFEKRSRLVLTNAQETDSSEFYCVAENRAGTAEANFTLHVSMRAAGMASLGSGQIVGISAALVGLIIFALAVAMCLLMRVKRQPYADSKTPNHLEVITSVNHQNAITNKTQPATGNGGIGIGGVVIANGAIPNCIDGTGSCAGTLERKSNNALGHGGGGGVGGVGGGGGGGGGTGIGGSKSEGRSANPVQKPPRLTDLPYTTSGYDNVGSVLSTAPCFISPTASAGNNPDLINDTKRFGSDEFTDLKISGILTANLGMGMGMGVGMGAAELGGTSGEYSRAGGCDSLYPSGLWEHASGVASSADDLFMKRYTDKTPIMDSHQLYDLHERSGGGGVGGGGSADYFSKTFPRTQPHYSNASMQQSNGGGGGSHTTGGGSGGASAAAGTSSASAMLHGGRSTTSTATTNLSAGSSAVMTGGGYPNDYGLPLVPGAEHQHNHHLQMHPLQQLQQQLNSTLNQHNATSGALGGAGGAGGAVGGSLQNSPHFGSRTLPRHALDSAVAGSGSGSVHSGSSAASSPIPASVAPACSSSSSTTTTGSGSILPNGQPVNAKTIRVWQKGGVPVLPPVTALKRALISSSRNSPDEGYQEGCGTDV